MIVSQILGRMNILQNQNYTAGGKTLEISQSITLLYRWKTKAQQVVT